MGRNWDKFLLLTWKNWLLQWRHPIQTVIEILAPVLFSALLVLLRGLVDPEPKAEITFPTFNLETFTLKGQFTRMAYSPCNNTAIDRIMENVADKLTLNATLNECFATGQALEDILWDNTEYTLAGVQFLDSFADMDTLSANTEIRIRFPSELRNSTEAVLNSWRTNLHFPLYQMAGPREPSEDTGAQPSYFNEGFLTLQYYIMQEIIKHHTGDPTIETPQVLMQRFPYSAWLDDPLQAAMQSFVGLMFLLSFVYPCINTVKVITAEKEKQLKEAMKIMGMANWLHWTAWFLKVFFFLLISIILMVVLLKVSWYPDVDYTVFTLTDPFLLFVFLVLYACATITFCFAISVFFSKANTATTIAGLAFFLSYAIYFFVQDQYHMMSRAQKMLICLASNSAMALGFQLIIMWEGAAEGLLWSNLFTPISPDDDFTMGHVFIMLIVDTILYLLIAIYVEAVFPGEYGVPQKWYFPFSKSYWCGTKNYTETSELDKLESDVYEKEPTNLKIGIQINKLTRVFAGKKVAVDKLSFNMFENQITVMLGHNGAGKTTTMSMLTGMITPTSGTAIINGYDIRTNMSQVRDSLGLCPQHNILFDDLTVAEHLYFFSKLKGLRGKEIQREIDTYVELLQLIPKRNARSQTLSGGMKRKLCVAMAMCGHSKICMLDEPTAGMDPAARRALWDMIVTQKKDRTIVLSTHFMDEADLLGDRIAILSGGKLQCYGSSFFLKKKYGAGYHLIMDKTKECQVNDVTDILRKYIPNIKVETNIGSELSYILEQNESESFEKMLSDLETNSKRLGVNSYGISLTTMEEVFMKVGTDHGNQDVRNDDDVDEPKEIDQNGSLNFSADSRVNLTGNEFVTGFTLRRNQFIAMMIKRIHVTFRNWILVIIQNFIPIAFLVITLVVARLMNTGNELPALELTLDKYTNPVTVVTSDQLDNPYFEQYLNILSASNRQVINWELGNMTANMIRETAENTPGVRMRYIIGASFIENSIISWFNNEPYHSPPVALQHSMNTILQRHTDSSHSVTFVNAPLPFSSQSRFDQMRDVQSVGFQIAFNIAFCMGFVTPFYALFYVKERVNKSKHLQFVSGARVSTFWIASFITDIISFTLTIICIIITLACFQEDGFSTAVQLARVCLILYIFIFATLPITYLASLVFEAPSGAYTKLTLIKVFLGAALFLVVFVLSIEDLNLLTVADALHYTFSIVPHYSIAQAFMSMSNLHTLINICEVLDNNEYNVPACFIQAQCCDINKNFFNFDSGMGVSLAYMAAVAVLATCLLFLIEYRVFDRLIYGFQNKTTSLPTTEDTDDSDVLEEKRKVRSGEISPHEYDLVLKDISKQYSNYFAVNQLCLGIKGYECFGLLGINGAGKTTTFKIMTGDVAMSHGDGWVRNINLKTNMKQVHRIIGYCPQFDALLDDLTGKETLTMYCLLRGIPFQDCAYISEKLAKDFDFYKHLNKLVKHYSGGNKRKLSSAVALIGDPPMIFLDEPTAGMDPATKRNLWNTLCKIRDSGKCLILTSHSMEECEALCTRLAIMVNGAFKCLGSTQHLKNKFSEGYILVVKVRKSDANGVLSSEELAPIEHLIRTNFPSAVLRESHQELLTYFIPDMTLAWSRMFGIMERSKKEIDHLEDYSLGQSSLEQVFLLFTKQQIIS